MTKLKVTMVNHSLNLEFWLGKEKNQSLYCQYSNDIYFFYFFYYKENLNITNNTENNVTGIYSLGQSSLLNRHLFNVP
jgi:hypothetical protein